jgi:hypothetical protein
MLYYYYHRTLLQRLLIFTEPSITPRFLKTHNRSNSNSSLDRILVSSFYFTGATWCIISLRVLALKALDPKRF